jgi:NAD+ diphosphatase
MSHCLDKFRYCPACGSDRFEVNDARSRRCADCGFTYYLNASAAVVGVLIDEQGRLLVARRANEPAKGTLDLPGGFVEGGESLDEALRRELMEETGALVSVERWLFSLPNFYRFSGMDVPTTDSFFLCRLCPGQQLHAADDVAALRWKRPEEIHPADFGLTSIRRGVEKLIALLATDR